MVGRFIGWILLSGALIMASAEGVLALETGSYDGLAAGDIWTLISGSSPSTGLASAIMGLPVWTVIMAFSLSLLICCRKRRRAVRRASFV